MDNWTSAPAPARTVPMVFRAATLVPCCFFLALEIHIFPGKKPFILIFLISASVLRVFCITSNERDVRVCFVLFTHSHWNKTLECCAVRVESPWLFRFGQGGSILVVYLDTIIVLDISSLEFVLSIQMLHSERVSRSWTKQYSCVHEARWWVECLWHLQYGYFDCILNTRF